MKLLLDEMHSARAAEHLRDNGHDVIAVTESVAWRALDDPAVFQLALDQSRIVVTENLSDFIQIASRLAERGQTFPGLVLTHPQRFDRGSRRYPHDLEMAFQAFLTDSPVVGDSWTWWLQPVV
jgi:hypothetical protein